MPALTARARTIAWIPLGVSVVVSTALVAWRHGPEAGGTLQIGGILLASASGFMLDDPAAETLGPSPTSLLRRRLRRVLLVAPVVGSVWALLVWWSHTHGPEEAWAFAILFAGLLGLSLGAAAVAGRRSGERQGGIAAGSAVLAMLLLSSAVPPRWRPLPLGDVPGGWPQIYLRWAGAAALGAIAFLASSRDPAAGWSRSTSRARRG